MVKDVKINVLPPRGLEAIGAKPYAVPFPSVSLLGRRGPRKTGLIWERDPERKSRLKAEEYFLKERFNKFKEKGQFLSSIR